MVLLSNLSITICLPHQFVVLHQQTAFSCALINSLIAKLTCTEYRTTCLPDCLNSSAPGRPGPDSNPALPPSLFRGCSVSHLQISPHKQPPRQTHRSRASHLSWCLISQKTAGFRLAFIQCSALLCSHAFPIRSGSFYISNKFVLHLVWKFAKQFLSQN